MLLCSAQSAIPVDPTQGLKFGPDVTERRNLEARVRKTGIKQRVGPQVEIVSPHDAAGLLDLELTCGFEAHLFVFAARIVEAHDVQRLADHFESRTPGFSEMGSARGRNAVQKKVDPVPGLFQVSDHAIAGLVGKAVGEVSSLFGVGVVERGRQIPAGRRHRDFLFSKRRRCFVTEPDDF